MGCPGVPWATALPSRLSTSRSRWAGAVTRGRVSGAAVVMVCWRSAAASASRSQRARTTAARSVAVVTRGSLPASRRASRSRLAICSCMAPMVRMQDVSTARSAGSVATIRRNSRSVRTAATGVRSSWAMLAMVACSRWKAPCRRSNRSLRRRTMARASSGPASSGRRAARSSGPRRSSRVPRRSRGRRMAARSSSTAPQASTVAANHMPAMVQALRCNSSCRRVASVATARVTGRGISASSGGRGGISAAVGLGLPSTGRGSKRRLARVTTTRWMVRPSAKWCDVGATSLGPASPMRDWPSPRELARPSSWPSASTSWNSRRPSENGPPRQRPPPLVWDTRKRPAMAGPSSPRRRLLQPSRAWSWLRTSTAALLIHEVRAATATTREVMPTTARLMRRRRLLRALIRRPRRRPAHGRPAGSRSRAAYAARAPGPAGAVCAAGGPPARRGRSAPSPWRRRRGARPVRRG